MEKDEEEKERRGTEREMRERSRSQCRTTRSQSFFDRCFENISQTSWNMEIKSVCFYVSSPLSLSLCFILSLLTALSVCVVISTCLPQTARCIGSSVLL